MVLFVLRLIRLRLAREGGGRRLPRRRDLSDMQIVISQSVRADETHPSFDRQFIRQFRIISFGGEPSLTKGARFDRTLESACVCVCVEGEEKREG